MNKRASYQDSLKQEMTDIIAKLELPELYKRSLEARWLDQVLWMDRRADQCRRWHYRLRLTTIIGGVILPALVSISLSDDRVNANIRQWTAFGAFGLSQVVAISAAIEEFCRFGDRWRQYRQTVETLKTEGWQYLQSSGTYQKSGKYLQSHKHLDNFPVFAARVESVIQKDVQVYITEVIKERYAGEEKQVLEKYSPEVLASNFVSTRSISQTVEAAPTSESVTTTASQSTAYATAPATASIPAYSPAYESAAPPTINGGTPIPAPAANPQPVLAPPTVPVSAASVTPSVPAKSEFRLKVLKDTVFKLSTQSADALPDDQKVLVKGDATYAVHSHAPAENKHVRVALLGAGLGPEHRNTWYVEASDIEIEGNEPDNQPNDRDDAPEPHGQGIRLPGLSQPIYLNMPVIDGGHFTWAEATKNGARIPDDDDIVEGIIRVAKVMEEVRSKLGDRTIRINSWYRDPASNRRAGGASKSRHMVGDAVDFVVDGIPPHEVYRQLEPWWGNRGGLASSSVFTHIDARGYKARWKYPF